MDQTKIWDYFQNNDEVGDVAFNARPRYEFLAKQILPGMSALNIGAGRGGLEAILVEKGVLVSSLDPGENIIERLRERHALGDRAKVGYSQAIPFADRTFDVVVMSEVLEHLTDEILIATIAEVRRVLNPNGQFIGTVPADENLVANRVLCPHCGEPFHRWGHLQSFGEERLRTLLMQHFLGLKISRHFFSDARTLNWKGRLGCSVKKFLVAVGVKGNGETFFFSAAAR